MAGSSRRATAELRRRQREQQQEQQAMEGIKLQKIASQTGEGDALGTILQSACRCERPTVHWDRLARLSAAELGRVSMVQNEGWVSQLMRMLAHERGQRAEGGLFLCLNAVAKELMGAPSWTPLAEPQGDGDRERDRPSPSGAAAGGGAPGDARSSPTPWIFRALAGATVVAVGGGERERSANPQSDETVSNGDSDSGVTGQPGPDAGGSEGGANSAEDGSGGGGGVGGVGGQSTCRRWLLERALVTDTTTAVLLSSTAFAWVGATDPSSDTTDNATDNATDNVTELELGLGLGLERDLERLRRALEEAVDTGAYFIPLHQANDHESHRAVMHKDSSFGYEKASSMPKVNQGFKPTDVGSVGSVGTVSPKLEEDQERAWWLSSDAVVAWHLLHRLARVSAALPPRRTARGSGNGCEPSDPAEDAVLTDGDGGSEFGGYVPLDESATYHTAAAGLVVHGEREREKEREREREREAEPNASDLLRACALSGRRDRFTSAAVAEWWDDLTQAERLRLLTQVGSW